MSRRDGEIPNVRDQAAACASPRDSLGRFTANQGWQRDDAIAAVRAFHDRHGYQPTCNEANTFNQLPTWSAARRLFGSWNGLIEASGFRPYPSRSSALAKVLAYRDRNPNWRAELSSKMKRRLLADYDEREAA